MSNNTYTTQELKVIKAIKDVLNYSDLESNLEDNCTILGIHDTELPVKIARGVFGSLIKKGILADGDGELQHNDFWVTDFGLNEYYRLFEPENCDI